MKTVVLLGDGMGDYAIATLNNQSPLQHAAMPNTRRLAAAGSVRLVQTIPEGMSPGSDVANLSIMGFDPRVYYTGRAPIEAAGAGLEPAADDVIFRCNLIHVNDGMIIDHSAGHITTDEGARIIATLQQKLGTDLLRFHPGAGYRHLLLWGSGPLSALTTPPHDVLGEAVTRHLPRGAGADAIMQTMDAARAILANHPVNLERLRLGKLPANHIWLWGQGRKTVLPSYHDLYGRTGGVVSAVDLVRGIGKLAGLSAPRIPGATGFLDTDYNAKRTTAERLLAAGHDFVFIHIEAPDECGHMGDLAKKIQAIEDFDREIVGPIWHMLHADGQPFRLIVTTDHRTPLAVRGHTMEPVPLLVYDGPTTVTDTEKPFDEFVDDGNAQELAFDYMRKLLTVDEASATLASHSSS